MSISISGSNSISGLSGNDTDFDKVLSQLKKIEETQLNRLEAWKSDWNLRYEGFTQIIEQIQAASSLLSTLSDKNNFVTKLVQSTNDNIITAVANASAQDVQHTISVSQVASNAIWANTGHIFESKNDIINDTGAEQNFNYTYAGKEYSFKVPANTTLESFASMINNSASNPGIKVSIISAGNGYVFQVAGKDTGVDNDLIIRDSNLVGMRATDSTSTWQTNSSLNLNQNVTDPTDYVFDLILRDGTKKSVTVKGTATAEELVNTLNRSAGGITASVDASGNLTIDGVQSFSRRTADDEAYVPGSTLFSLSGDWAGGTAKLNATGGIAEGLADTDLLEFSVTLEGETAPRTFTIAAGASKRDLYMMLGQNTQAGDGIVTEMDEHGNWGVRLSGVTDVSVTQAGGSAIPKPNAFSTAYTDPKGVKNTLGASITSATTTLTFDKDKLANQINGKKDGEGKDDLVYTLALPNGDVRTINGKDIGLTSDMSNEDMIDKITAEINSWGVPGISAAKGTDADGNTTLTLNGVKSITATTGTDKGAYTTDLKVTTRVPASNPSGTQPVDSLFQTVDGKYVLEEAPDLVYTITTNDGQTGTLTMRSGTSMKDVLAAMRDPSGAGWSWTGTPPDASSWQPSFTDAGGNPVDLDTVGDGQVYLNLTNVQSVSGPGISGQVATSSNWSIQRAANCRYTVDNWPIEMESTTNTVSDVIEGVVFTVQDTGDARISVSTDITSVEKSIQDFLDAVNSVILTVNELMKYDENKQTTSNDPNDIGNDNYSASGLTNQKGNLLTGNYGVQLFKSRFTNMLTTTPAGFMRQADATNVLSGDLLASLAQLGIKTDTDSTSDTYGLLTIAPSSTIAELQSIDKENYTDMITNHLQDVVDFFCASGTGTSTSTDFRYGSHVQGITKAGNYEVTYTVSSTGEITNVMVGGQPAKRDESQPGNYFSVATGDPRGLSILIDDLTVGDHPPAGKDPMYVRVKEGLVQTTNNFLKGELVYNDVNISVNSTPDQIADAIALKSQNGALMSLRDNYKKVMESIDVKIEREERRIDTWYARQKAIFANLETLLSQYGEQQKTLEAQLSQLSGSSK